MVLSLDRWVGKVAVVTGASSGIGAAIAEKLVEEGLIVVGLARRVELIEELQTKLENKKGKLYAYKTDLTKEEDIKNAFEWVTKSVGNVSVLINNSGIHFRQPLLNGNSDQWRQSFDVNVLGLCIATREAVNIMRENNIDGQIVNINSIAGHQVYQISGNDVYPASKFAVTALTETLRLELASANSGIRVTSISPGAADTAIFSKELRETETYKSVIGNRILKPSDVADAVAYVLSTPQRVTIKELTIQPTGQPF